MNFRKVGMVFVVLVILTTTSHIQLESNAKNVSVAVVQGNDKNRYLTPQEIEEEYLTNSHLELAAAIKGKRDIIVFPESAFNDDIEQDAVLKNDLRRISNKSKELIIANSIATEGQDDFNRNYFYSPEMKLLGTYDKKRLVPFGEYVPGDKFIGSWEIFDDIGLGYKKGESDLTVRGVTSVICYESTFTQDVRNALRDDSKLLVVTTNNRSYRRSGNSAQHLAQSRLRAAEFGISVVHASVSGSSALIERDGSVTERSKLFERKVVSGDLSFGKSDSIYSRTGDWLSLLALLVVVYLCLEQLRKRKWKNQT